MKIHSKILSVSLIVALAACGNSTQQDVDKAASDRAAGVAKAQQGAQPAIDAANRDVAKAQQDGNAKVADARTDANREVDQAVDKQPGWIEVSLRPVEDGRQVEITVRDNGRGMSAREQRRAFEPGYTTRRRGWGLGLTLARRVVEDAHGGRIWIQSSVPGQGTTMAIRLPAATA